MNCDIRKPTLGGAGAGFILGAWIGHQLNKPAPFLELLLVPATVLSDHIAGNKKMPPVKKKFDKDIILGPLVCGIIFACLGAGVGSVSALTYRSIKHKFAKKPTDH